MRFHVIDLLLRRWLAFRPPSAPAPAAADFSNAPESGGTPASGPRPPSVRPGKGKTAGAFSRGQRDLRQGPLASSNLRSFAGNERRAQRCVPVGISAEPRRREAPGRPPTSSGTSQLPLGSACTAHTLGSESFARLQRCKESVRQPQPEKHQRPHGETDVWPEHFRLIS